MCFRDRLFAACYDALNWGVEGRVATYRRYTAGQTWGDVLEIGGGTGANLPYYPPDVRLTVVEPNPHMVMRLRRKAQRVRREINVVSGVGEELAFAEASFNCVVTTLVLCMVEDLERVVSEARRVLMPGGSFFFYEHVVSPRCAGRKWQDRLNPAWNFITTGCNLNRDIAGAINNAGFRSVDVTAFDLSIGMPITIPNIVGIAAS